MTYNYSISTRKSTCFDLFQDPISFHKFTGTNPLKIYDDWFKLPDKELRKFMNTRNQEL